MSTEKEILMLKRVHVWDYGILAFGYKTLRKQEVYIASLQQILVAFRPLCVWNCCYTLL